jgi:hypothetical protein
VQTEQHKHACRGKLRERSAQAHHAARRLVVEELQGADCRENLPHTEHRVPRRLPHDARRRRGGLPRERQPPRLDVAIPTTDSARPTPSRCSCVSPQSLITVTRSGTNMTLYTGVHIMMLMTSKVARDAGCTVNGPTRLSMAAPFSMNVENIWVVTEKKRTTDDQEGAGTFGDVRSHRCRHRCVRRGRRGDSWVDAG